MNGHPRGQAKVSVHCRWPLIRGNLTLKCVGRGIDNVAVQGRWPLTTGVAQGMYYYSYLLSIIACYFDNVTGLGDVNRLAVYALYAMIILALKVVRP